MWHRVICESLLWVLWVKVGQRQVATNGNPQAKLQTWTFVFVLYYYSTMRLMLFTIPWRMEGWVDHRHCSICAAMPKTVYIAVILWKTQKRVRSLGSIMAPLTLQTSMLPLNHWNTWLWLISNWSVAPTEHFWKPKSMSSDCNKVLAKMICLPLVSITPALAFEAYPKSVKKTSAICSSAIFLYKPLVWPQAS